MATFLLDYLGLFSLKMADAQPISQSTPKAMSVGSQLCTECGLCCTGSLHDAAAGKPHEAEWLRGKGLEIMPGEMLRFALPCPHLKGASCGIYEDRPHVCSRYRCQLLRNVEAGDTELQDALLKAREGRRLHDQVRRLLPSGMTLSEARALPRDPERVGARRHPLLYVNVVALMRYVDRHFRHADEGPLLSEEVLIMDAPANHSEKDIRNHV